MGDMVYERVPHVKKRVGDAVLAGSNNTLLLLGRDRPNSLDSGYGDDVGSGAIYIGVGRANEDPSLLNDRASLYVAMRTDPDDNSGITFGSKRTATSAVLARADCIRMSARVDIKLSSGNATLTIGDGKIVLDGEISLGEGAAERLLKGETFVRWAASHTHAAPNGPTSPPVQPVPPDALSSRPVRVA